MINFFKSVYEIYMERKRMKPYDDCFDVKEAEMKAVFETCDAELGNELCKSCKYNIANKSRKEF